MKNLEKVSVIKFDEVISRLRFNLESAKSAVEGGECEASDREALDTYIQKLREDIRKLEIAKGIAHKKDLTSDDVKAVMAITCFADLGYCCGLQKECIWRDSCRQALGIDDATFTAFKEALIWQMLQHVDKAVIQDGQVFRK